MIGLGIKLTLKTIKAIVQVIIPFIWDLNTNEWQNESRNWEN